MLRYQVQTCLGLVLVLALSACGAQNLSTVKGHYEEATAASIEAYKGQQRVPAVYANTKTMIISQPLLTSYGREDLVRAILNAGV